jgi:hypothetical protein
MYFKAILFFCTDVSLCLTDLYLSSLLMCDKAFLKYLMDCFFSSTALFTLCTGCSISYNVLARVSLLLNILSPSFDLGLFLLCKAAVY